MLRGEELIQLSTPRLVETESGLNADTTERTMLAVTGHASACDVWFKVPTAWEAVVILRLYARVGDARVLLKTVRINEAHRSTAGGFVSGTAMSVRGRPVTSFELTAQTTSGSLTNGQFMLYLWHANEAPAIVGGVVGVSPQAGEERSIAQMVVRNDTTPVFAAADPSGRMLLVGAGTAGSPTGGVVTVQGGGAAGAISNKPVRSGVMYGLASPSVAKPSVTATGTHWLMTVRSGGSKRVEVQRIAVSYHGVTTADGRLIICRATADGTNGTVSTSSIQKFDSSDASPGATARTFSTGSPLGLASPLDLTAVAIRGDDKGTFVFDADAWGKPIVLASSGETLGIRFVVDTTATSGTIALCATVHWVEI